MYREDRKAEKQRNIQAQRRPTNKNKTKKQEKIEIVKMKTVTAASPVRHEFLSTRLWKHWVIEFNIGD
jgi:hypothetical protein